MRIRHSLCVCLALIVIVSACSSSGSDDGSVAAADDVPAASTTTKGTSTTSATTLPPVGGIDGLVASSAPDGVGAVFVGVFGETSAEVAAAGVDGDGNPATPDQAWETASLVKMIVATSVLQLVDQGLVDLDAPVGSYVDIPIAEGILVRDVLSHRSGVADMYEHLSSCPTEATLDVMKERAGAQRHQHRRRPTRIPTTSFLVTSSGRSRVKT
jgi:D-alanyl-D-alanine carboxypeptidase